VGTADKRKTRIVEAGTSPRVLSFSDKVSIMPQRAKIKWDDDPNRYNPFLHGSFDEYYRPIFKAKRAENAAARLKTHETNSRKVRKPKPDAKPDPNADLYAEMRAARANDVARYSAMMKAKHPVLRSDEYAILLLFTGKLHRKHKLRVGATKAEVYRPDSKYLGLHETYVDGNHDMRGYIRGDLDQDFESWDHLWAYIDSLGCPMPNVGVAHVEADGTVVRPHLLWILEKSVVFTAKGFTGKGGGRHAGLHLRVSRGLCGALIPAGADPGALSNPLKTKNPLCFDWAYKVFRDEPWSLEALKPFVDINLSMSRLEKMRAAMNPQEPIPDHPDPVIGGSSNAIYNHVGRYARAAVGGFRDRFDHKGFDDYVYAEALRVSKNSEAAEKIAAYTGNWAWNHYYKNARPTAMAPEARSAAKSAAATKGRQSAAAKTAAKVRAAKDQLTEKLGRAPSRFEISITAGVSERTVARVLSNPVLTPVVPKIVPLTPRYDKKRGMERKNLKPSFPSLPVVVIGQGNTGDMGPSSTPGRIVESEIIVMNTEPEPDTLPPTVFNPEVRVPGAIYLSSPYEGLAPLPPGGWGVQVIKGPPAFLRKSKQQLEF
jgi:hypothetical protein